MFDVTLYTFAKKQRSTKIPSGTGTTVSCMAKEPLDILNPVIRLQIPGGAAADPHAYNYARIQTFGRYYHIRTWRNVGPLWEADLQVDALASWRTQIGTQSIYVYRAAYSYDLLVPDNLYPTKAQTRILNIALPKPWTIGGPSASGAAIDSGIFIAGIISTSGTTYYGFTPDAWSLFLYELYRDNYYDAVLSEFGAVEYPEAKVAVNPMQYISTVKWCPVGYGASGTWCIHIGSAVTTIPVGVASVTLSGLGVYSAWVISDQTVTSVEDIDTETADFEHPQSAERGSWLNYAPYTSYELFYPPFGLIELDPVMIHRYRYLRVSLSLDTHTCTCKLDVYCHDNNTRRVIYRGVAPFGVEVPVSAIMQPGTSPLSFVRSALGVAGGVLSAGLGNPIGGASQIVGSISGAIGSAVAGQIPHLSTMGGPGSTAALDGAPRLYVTQWYLAADDLNDRGRPLCAIRQISTIPGYIMGDADSISISCTAQELQEIQQAVAGGFYYE